MQYEEFRFIDAANSSASGPFRSYRTKAAAMSAVSNSWRLAGRLFRLFDDPAVAHVKVDLDAGTAEILETVRVNQ